MILKNIKHIIYKRTSLLKYTFRFQTYNNINKPETLNLKKLSLFNDNKIEQFINTSNINLIEEQTDNKDDMIEQEPENENEENLNLIENASTSIINNILLHDISFQSNAVFIQLSRILDEQKSRNYISNPLNKFKISHQNEVLIDDLSNILRNLSNTLEIEGIETFRMEIKDNLLNLYTKLEENSEILTINSNYIFSYLLLTNNLIEKRIIKLDIEKRIKLNYLTDYYIDILQKNYKSLEINELLNNITILFKFKAFKIDFLKDRKIEVDSSISYVDLNKYFQRISNFKTIENKRYLYNILFDSYIAKSKEQNINYLIVSLKNILLAYKNLEYNDERIILYFLTQIKNKIINSNDILLHFPMLIYSFNIIFNEVNGLINKSTLRREIMQECINIIKITEKQINDNYSAFKEEGRVNANFIVRIFKTFYLIGKLNKELNLLSMLVKSSYLIDESKI